MILLDTHVLLWFVDGDPRLGAVARDQVDAAFKAENAAFAAISMWEIGMLHARGHIILTMPPERWIASLIAEGLKLVDVTRQIALDAGLMPRMIHGDPGDRIIMATARAMDCALVTADQRILVYGADGYVQVIDARR